MDEPTASLDFGNRLRVLDIVKDLGARGLAVILSTHEPEQAFAVADQVAVIAAGRLFAHGAPNAVLTGETLSQVYGVAVAVEATASGRHAVVPVPRA
jgi:iron complex transport system ATP-binding protein